MVFVPHFQRSWWIFLPAVATALHPTVGTVKPSAMLGVVGVKTGVPAFKAIAKLGHLSGSTPMTLMLGFMVFKATAHPTVFCEK